MAHRKSTRLGRVQSDIVGFIATAHEIGMDGVTVDRIAIHFGLPNPWANIAPLIQRGILRLTAHGTVAMTSPPPERPYREPDVIEFLWFLNRKMRRQERARTSNAPHAA